MKQKEKLVLFSVVAVFALFAMIIVPSALADVPPSKTYPADAVWFDPEDSSAEYCETVDVDVWINISNNYTIDVYGVFDYPFDCVNVTKFVGNMTNWPTFNEAGLTQGHVIILAANALIPPVPPGVTHVGTLTIQCCNETSSCISDLVWDTEKSYIENTDYLEILPVAWYDGTVTCQTVEKPDLVVEKSVTIADGNFTVNYTVTNIGTGTAVNESTTCKYVDGVEMENQTCPALGPGESYNGTFMPESCPCGETLNVTVCADNDNVVDESNETNNCEVNIVECPYLEVDIRADGIASNIFDVADYMICPGTVTEDGITIDNETAMGAVVAYCQDNSINVNLTLTEWGVYLVQIGNDPADNNNWMYAVNEAVPPVGGAVKVIVDGDMVHWYNYNLNYYEVLTTLDKTEINVDDYLTASVTWKNITGTYKLNGSDVFVADTAYASGDNVGTTNDDGNCTFQWSTPGTWYVYAVDPVHGSGQYNYPPVSFICSVEEKPDLVVEKSVTIADGNFTVNYTVTNIGTGTAVNESTTCKYVDGVEMENQTCPALGPGESYNGTFMPESCPCGETLNVTVCADNEDVVVESNETNNCEVNIVECPYIEVDIRADGIASNIFDVADYMICPGTVTEDGITIDNETAMGAVVAYCQDNSINVNLTLTEWGVYLVQIGNDPADNNNWMYAVNEAVPPVGGAVKVIVDGDMVHWYNYNLHYYEVLTTLDKTEINVDDYLTASVTWKNITGTYKLNGSDVFVADTAYASGDNVGTTNDDGNCTFQWSTLGTWYVYAVDPIHGSGQYNYPPVSFTCSVEEKPDLVVEKSVAIEDGNFTVNYTVTNMGTGTAVNESTTCKYVDGERKESQTCPALGPGESYNGTFMPESCPCGETLNVTVCADNDKVVDESNETNNCEVNIVDCLPCPKPDLKVEKSVEVGDDGNFVVNYTVTNIGGSEAGESKTCKYVDGVEMENQTCPALGPGASHSSAFNPEECPCGVTLNVTVCADNDDVVVESDETNNCEVNIVECPAVPDLTVEKSVEVVDGMFIVSYTVTNNGCGQAGESKTCKYVDGVEMENQTCPALGPGASHSSAFNPEECPCGVTLNVTVCADNDDVVDESDENNNCEVNIVECPAVPDLTVEKSVEVVDGMFIVSYTVTNNGCGQAGESKTCKYVDGVEMENQTCPALGPGASHSSAFNPEECPCGATLNVTVCADNDDVVDESDENNNCEVNIVECPAVPDLTVEKSVEVVDGMFIVSYTVTNNGCGQAGESKTCKYVDGVEMENQTCPALGPGASHSSAFNPEECPCGATLNVTVCADNDDVVDESDENNNCEVNIVECPAVPDLTVEKSVEVVDGMFIVSYTVTNNGCGQAGESKTCKYVDGVEMENQTCPALGPGASHSSAFNPEECPCGATLNVTVCADNDDVVVESDETNNCEVNIGECPAVPDLTVEKSVEVVDGMFIVSYTVTNNGCGQAGESKTCKYVDGVEMENQTCPALGPGASHSSAFNPEECPCGVTLNVTVCADNDDVVDESDENNNCEVNIVECPAVPDLTVEKSVEVVDGMFIVSYTVTNNGCGQAGESKTCKYVDGVEMENQTCPALGPGASHSSAFNPEECPCGATLNVTVCADNDDVVVESDETNNCEVNIVECPAVPDLTVEKSVEVVDGMFIVSYTVTNNGCGQAGESKTCKYVDGVEMENQTCPALGPGASHSSAFNPEECPCGVTLNVTVCADNDDVVDESDENNNCEVNIVECPEEEKPDLEIEKSVTIEDGEFTVDYTVTNIGIGTAEESTTCKYVDGELKESQECPALGSGESHTGTFEPEPCPGGATLNVTVCADNDDVVVESDETNNCEVNIVECPEEEKPDLEIEKSVTIEDGEFTVDYTVTNIGIGTAEESTTCKYVDGERKESQECPALGSGESHTGTFEPEPCPGGATLNVTVCADNDKVVDESDENNNCEVNFIDCPYEEKPDLEIVKKWEEWVNNKKRIYSVSYVIFNNGTATAPSGHYTTLYVDGEEVEHKHVPADLAPGDSYTDTFDTVVECTENFDTIKVCADNYNVIDELNETNNCLENVWPPHCPAETAVYRADVPDADGILDTLREQRDDNLKDEYVDRYYDNSQELTEVMVRDPALTHEAARLLSKYSPMVSQDVHRIDVDTLITERDVDEIVSFIDRFKESVLNTRDGINAESTEELIKFLDEFEKQVEASEGKTFSEALHDSIYYIKDEQLPDLVIEKKRKEETGKNGSVVCYDITNIGTETAPAGHHTSLYIDGNETEHKLVPVDLAPGESYTATFDTVLKDTVKSDTIRLCADSYDVVDEIDEANNCLEYVWPPTPTSRPKQPEKIKQKRAE